MKNLMSVICLNFMYRGEESLCYLAQTLLFMGVTVRMGEVIQNSLMSLGGQEEMSQIRKIAPTHLLLYK